MNILPLFDDAKTNIIWNGLSAFLRLYSVIKISFD